MNKPKPENKMKIWVDADACPKVIKEILFRAAIRTQTLTTLVANKRLEITHSPFIKSIHVAAGFDVADNRIIEELSVGDLVITADIPLADAAIHKGASALDPRGQLYSENNIKQRLSMRNLNEELRDLGVISGGPAKLSKREIQSFANWLDKFLSCR